MCQVSRAEINSIVFSPNGQTVAVATGDGSALILAANDGLGELSRVNHEGGAVNVVAFSPDNTLVATAGNDKTVRIARTVDGLQLATIPHGVRVRALSFSPNGRLLATGSEATGSDDGYVHILTVPHEPVNNSQGIVRARIRQTGEVAALAFDPSGEYMAAGGGDDHAHIYPIYAGFGEQSWIENGREVRALAFSPDSKFLATANGDGSALVERPQRKVERFVKGRAINAIAFSPNGSLVAMGDDRGMAEVRLIEDGEIIESLDLEQAITRVSFSGDGRFFAATGLNGKNAPAGNEELARNRSIEP
jgi:WD40 repeat protein